MTGWRRRGIPDGDITNGDDFEHDYGVDYDYDYDLDPDEIPISMR